MSVPKHGKSRHGSTRWEVVRYALGSNARTLRLCLIWLVMTAAPVAGAVLTELIRHVR
jgi:hypothetical protein